MGVKKLKDCLVNSFETFPLKFMWETLLEAWKLGLKWLVKNMNYVGI